LICTKVKIIQNNVKATSVGYEAGEKKEVPTQSGGLKIQMQGEQALPHRNS
jgi:hypothetical protein